MSLLGSIAPLGPLKLNVDMGTGTVNSATGLGSVASRESNSRNANTQHSRGMSREDSCALSAIDFLTSPAPIDYDKSNRSRALADSLQEISQLLGDNKSVSSNDIDNRSYNSTATSSVQRGTGVVGGGGGGGGKIAKGKTSRLNRIPNADAASVAGVYQHVHSEEKIPQWGTTHDGNRGGKGGSLDAHVVLGISGVNSIGGHVSKVPVYASTNASSIGGYGQLNNNNNNSSNLSRLGAAGNALLSSSSGSSILLGGAIKNNAGTKSMRSRVGQDFEPDMPEVRVKSYNVPAQGYNYNQRSGLAGHVIQQQIMSDDLRSSNNSRGSANGGNGGNGGNAGARGGGRGDLNMGMGGVMLDSPTLGGSNYSGFDFEKDRKNPLRIAGELPPSQEVVNGIIYNHRYNAVNYRTEGEFTNENAADTSTRDSKDGAHLMMAIITDNEMQYQQEQKQRQLQQQQKQAYKIDSSFEASSPNRNGGGHNNSINNNGHSNTSGGHNGHSAATDGVSEDVLKRLRRELLSN